MSAFTPPTEFGLFTSLRYDPQLVSSEENTRLSGLSKSTPFYKLQYHFERLLSALEHFDWAEASQILKQGRLASVERYHETLKEAVDSYLERGGETGPFKIRSVIYPDGKLETGVAPTPPVDAANLFPPRLSPPGDIRPPLLNEAFEILPDVLPTPVSSHTSYKTTPRPHYDLARTRALAASETSSQEVLIWNDDKVVMEGSRTNVYFWRDGWVTPSEQTGCLRGVGRRWVLENGWAREEDVRLDQVVDGEIAVLSNGLRGFWAGRVRLVPCSYF